MGSREFSANGYDFSVQYDPQTNRGTTTVHGEGQHEKGHRDSVPVKSADLKSEKYEDGHIIGVAANAPEDPDNHMAQAQHLNRSEYKSVENAEGRIAARTDGTKIEVGRDISWHMNAQGDKVAENYLINDTITYPDGHQEQVHLSFTNLPPEDMEKIDAAVSQMDFDGPNSMDNPGFEGMSREDIEEILNWDGLSIREEFEPTHVSEPSRTEETPGNETPPDAGNDISAGNDGVDISGDSGLDDGGADSPGEGVGDDDGGIDGDDGGIDGDDGGIE